MTRRRVAGAVLVGMIRVIVATGAMAQEVGALAQAKLPAARDAMLDEALRQAVHNVAAALAASNFRLKAEATEHQSK